MHFQLMHESLARFSESFASFLYGLNMNAFCVDFPEVSYPMDNGGKKREGRGGGERERGERRGKGEGERGEGRKGETRRKEGGEKGRGEGEGEET